MYTPFKKNFNKRFNENSRVLSVRVPESQYTDIKNIVYKFIDDFTKDKSNNIETWKNGFREVVKVLLEILTYFENSHEPFLRESKFNEFYNKANSKLVDSLIDQYIAEKNT